MSKLLRAITIALAAGFVALAPAAGLAQTKPSVTSLGPDYPKTAIFIGNSFFYYNNGMPGHVSLLEKADDRLGFALRLFRADDRRMQQLGESNAPESAGGTAQKCASRKWKWVHCK